MVTKREFLQAVAELNERPELAEYATAEIEKMDIQNERRKAQRQNSAKAKENAALGQAVLQVLADGQQVQAKVIVERLKEQEIDVTTQKITAVLKPLIENGQVEQIYPKKRHLPAEYAIRQWVKEVWEEILTLSLFRRHYV